MFDSPDLLAAIQAHARDEYPKESCGVVTPTCYVPLANVSPEPETAFDCADQFDQHMMAGTALALVHSHPNQPGTHCEPWACPSSDDMRAQIAMDLPWGLLNVTPTSTSKPFFWGDPVPRPPLEGRLFRHGPSGTDGRGDCYALIRDWFKAHGVDLVEGPRDWRWWEKPQLAGANLYEENFARAGFVQVRKDDVRVGDVGLVAIPCMSQGGAAVPLRACHGVVYVGEGRVIHHRTGRKSCIEPLKDWNNLVLKWIRHGDLRAA